MSANLLLHAIRMIVNNLGDALKASIGPFALLAVALFLLAGAFDVPLSAVGDLGAQGAGMDPQVAASVGLFSLVAAVLYLVVFAWVAVTWHRFILLAEYPPIFPSPAGKPIGTYLLKSVQLALLMIVVLIPAGFAAGLLLAPIAMGSPVIGGVAIAVALGGIAGFMWLRLGLALPATAIGESFGIRDSWARTQPMSGTIFGVAVLLILMNLVIGIPAALAGPNIVGVLLDLAATWFTLMVGVGILTTLYGHIVEGRSIS